MSENLPFFSILIPSYNQDQYLGPALDSLLKQTFLDWEAIIVNDGSTDATKQVIEAYCLKDQRFRALHKENGGTGSALNAGLQLALGEWVCWLSSDDFFEPYKLQTHFDWTEKSPGSKFFFTHFRELDESTGKLIDSEHWLTLPKERFQVIDMLQANYIAGISICIHRDAWGKVGMFNETLRYGQDYDMWLRLLAVYPATYIPVRTCIIRRHPQQEGHRFPQAMLYDSAKAAIQFLNGHSLVEVFPLIDLNNPKSAWEAIDKALTVAENKKAFIYCLGSNPILIFRIMEWWCLNKRIFDQEFVQQIHHRVLKAKYLNQYKEFSYLWKMATALTSLNLSLVIKAVEPADIAEATLMRTNAFRSQPMNRAALRLWLKRFENRQLSQEGNGFRGSSKNILLISQEFCQNSDEENDVNQKVLKVAERLHKLGNNVLVVNYNKQQKANLVYKYGLLVINLENSYNLDDIILKFGFFDISVMLGKKFKYSKYHFLDSLVNIEDVNIEKDNIALKILNFRHSTIIKIKFQFLKLWHNYIELMNLIGKPRFDMILLRQLCYEFSRHKVATFYWRVLLIIHQIRHG